MKRLPAALRRLPFVAVLGAALVFVACSGSTIGSTGIAPTGGPSPTATPVIPGGDYAFVRDGDLWARTGASIAHAVTFLHVPATGTAWGLPVWSPDRTKLAFVLFSPPVAPGQPPNAPGLGAGTVLIVNLTTGKITSLHGSANGYQVPLSGRHVAWKDNSTLLFTEAGTVQEASLGQTVSFTALAGPKEVWEIAVHSNTLFYTTVTGITPDGSGTAELHRFDLSNKGTDTKLATLGPVTLPSPPATCGILCPPDTATPYVPYAWDVSGDGSQIAYQQANATSSATPTTAAGPTPTQPPSTAQFVLAHGDGSQTQPIFQNIATPADPLDLAFAPDGQHIALAPAGAGTAFASPWVQGLAPQPSAPLAIQPPPGAGNQVTLSGPLTWSSDSHVFSLVLHAIPAQRTTQVYTFTATGQSALTEVNAGDFAWAGA